MWIENYDEHVRVEFHMDCSKILPEFHVEFYVEKLYKLVIAHEFGSNFVGNKYCGKTTTIMKISKLKVF